MELSEFLAARLGEDEAAANEATQETTGKWATREAWSGGLFVWDECGALILHARTSSPSPQYPHIARHDPARVLADVAAKRAILAQHPAVKPDHGPHEDEFVCGSETDMDDPYNWVAMWPCQTLRHLAAIWAAHPDYDPAWAPEGATP